MTKNLLNNQFYFMVKLSGGLFKYFCFVLYLTFTVSLFHNITFSQQPTQEWAVRIPGPYNDLYGPFLSVDKNGNSYVAGTHVVNDSINILCTKYNTAGVQQWSTLYKYPGYGYFVPTGLAIDSSGNAYVISGIALTSLTPRNMLIAKFNSITGIAEWGKTYFGQYSQSSFFDIKIDRQNNIYVAGSSDSSHLLIRYNTNGDTVWVRKYHPPWLCAEYMRKCTLDDSLNIIFTGQRRFYYPPFGWYDSLVVAKYSQNGILRWESTFAYNLLGSDIGTKITADQNGNSYIGGITSASGDVVYLTLKYDRNGNRQWFKIYETPGNGNCELLDISLDKINNSLFATGRAVTNGIQKATTIKYNPLTGDSVWIARDTGTYKYGDSRAIKTDSIGNTYITGVTSSTGSNAPVDFLTIKYSQTGVRSWLMTYNAPFNGIDIGRDICLDGQNNVYILGTSQSGLQISDYVLIKYNQIMGISPVSNEIPENFELLQNYPNPFNPVTKIKFEIPEISNINITVFDILGRAAESPVDELLKPGVYEISINSAGYSSGTYFYRMMANGKIIDTKKFIIIK